MKEKNDGQTGPGSWVQKKAADGDRSQLRRGGSWVKAYGTVQLRFEGRAVDSQKVRPEGLIDRLREV